MGLSYPTRRGNSSLTLVVTFGLGLLIGAALFYAVADSMGWDFSARSAGRTANAPAPAPAPAPAEPAPPAKTPPAEIPDTTPPPAPAVEPPPAPETPTTPPAPIEVNISDDEIAKHLMVDLQGTALDDESKALLTTLKPGLVVLRAQNLQDKVQGVQLIKDIKATGGGTGLDSWPLIAVSQEGGADNPLFVADVPSAQTIADGNDFEKNVRKARDVAISYGAAAREMQVSVVLAPRLDVFDPKLSDPSLEARSFGTIAQDAADLGNSFQLGLREAGALAVAKHFPGVGAAIKGDDGMPTIPHMEVRLLVELLLPFSDAAANGVAGMLVAHVRVPGLEQATPEISAAQSTTLIQRILREQMSYAGVVIADDISSSPLTSAQPVGEAVSKSFVAGCDVVYLGALEGTRVADAAAGVRAAMEKGDLSQESWAASSGRLDRWREFLRQPPLAKAPKPKVEPAPQPKDTEKKVHRVERGETLEGLAKTYGVTVDEIMAWNALEDKKARYAQRLNIYAPIKPKVEEKKQEDSKPEVEKAPEEPKPEAAPKDDPKPAEAPEVAPSVPEIEKKEEPKPEEKPAEVKPDEKAEARPFQLHEIVKGDTLRRLADRYKTSEKELLKMNNLSSPDKILLGTKLKVPKQ